jgi:serine/threonine protein kinase
VHSTGRAQIPFGDEVFTTVVQPLDPEIVANLINAEDDPTVICPPLETEEATPTSKSVCPFPIKHAVDPGRRYQMGKYEVRQKLGRGSFGVVYLARDPSLDRDIAIKVLRPRHLSNRDIVHRFLQEARATARITHPGIVTIYDCGLLETTDGPTAFIAMELLSGESLARRLARAGRLAPATAVEIARQVASALEAAHRVHVLHRDLKPDNIHLVPDPAMPSGERVKILDFGLAKLGREGHTQVQNVFGTPRYMSPEQCRSSAQVDHRSDVYALGCILFELIAGVPPFDGDVRRVIDCQQRVRPPRVSSLAPDCPVGLDALIDAMLAKSPSARPQTMTAVQHALQTVLDGPIAASTLGRPPPGALFTPTTLQFPRLMLVPPQSERDAAVSGEIHVSSSPDGPMAGPRAQPRRTTQGYSAGLAMGTPFPGRPRATTPLTFGESGTPSESRASASARCLQVAQLGMLRVLALVLAMVTLLRRLRRDSPGASIPQGALPPAPPAEPST